MRANASLFLGSSFMVFLNESLSSDVFQVSSVIYNHPKVEEGYNDDNTYSEPFRKF